MGNSNPVERRSPDAPGGDRPLFRGLWRPETAAALSPDPSQQKHLRPKRPRALGKHGARDRDRTGDPQLGKLRHSVRLRPGLYRDQQLTSAGVRGHPPLFWSKLWSKLWSNWAGRPALGLCKGGGADRTRNDCREQRSVGKKCQLRQILFRLSAQMTVSPHPFAAFSSPERPGAAL